MDNFLLYIVNIPTLEFWSGPVITGAMKDRKNINNCCFCPLVGTIRIRLIPNMINVCGSERKDKTYERKNPHLRIKGV